jgi:hypothetical protein
MSDDTPETLRLTYAELAKARGITLAAARRMTFRHRWPKQIGNDGFTRVMVPVTAVISNVARDVNPTGDIADDMPGNIADDIPVNGNVDKLAWRKSAEASINGAGMSDSMLATMTSTLAATVSATMMADVMRIAATSEAAIVSLREQLAVANARADQAEQRNKELQATFEAEIAEYRRLIAMFTEKLTARRRWWPWRSKP